MMRGKSGIGFLAMATIGTAMALASPASAQAPDQEDHPALSLSEPAPVMEDHPALPTLAAPSAPVAAAPPSAPTPGPSQQDKVTAGISFLNPTMAPAAAPAPDLQSAPPATVPPGGATVGQGDGGSPAQTGTTDPAKTAEAPPSDPVTLTHPAVADTARLVSDSKTITLFGIVGLSGSFAEDLHGAISSDGDKVICQAQTTSEYMCLLVDGTDVAALALRNGAAQTRPDSPDTYHDLETAARDERRGVWHSLPPPPVHVEHPTVVNTATLTSGGQTYMLDGVDGLAAQYARDMQGYIAANGDSLMCNPQGDSGHYVCLLPDGTDVAKVALVNGAARVAPDAPDSYRVEQGDALDNKRGFWKNPPPDVLMAMTTTTARPSTYTIVSGDNGSDGITYVGGAPATIIDGETVFLGYGGDGLGWGYWDHYHHWMRAPGGMGEHMNRFHPGGMGLRGYGGGMHEAAFRPGGMGGRPGAGFIRPGPSGGGFHPGGGGMHVSAPSGGGRHR